MSIRLGAACAVVDDEGRVLLSKRDDLNVWNLPGGRLGSGEKLAAAAAREVREETGLIVHVERPVNLYFWQGFQRLNVLYTGWPLGGQVQPRTAETRDNQYFAPDALPKMLNAAQVRAVFSETRLHPEISALSPRELRSFKRRLGVRWVQNLLRGKPEPRYPHFEVRAVAVVWNDVFSRVLTLEGRRGRVLPRLRCGGLRAPWVELADRMKQHQRLNPAFQWVGVWQDAAHDTLEFVFAAAVPEKAVPHPAEWSSVLNTPLGDRDLEYVGRVRPSFINDPVWTLDGDDDLRQDDVFISRGAGV
jgi:ADP-ribose pyrophosphatase YjhB (NUDIX family)